ncbi:GTPase [Arthrobacter roseus]|uniref:GTPase n=1 Tax=Arthrobacter roseus TaxID=136274 RepID=UPI00196594BE|nr:GTP-binding protein EngB required for normal cell division [Arthrobacter roseus]
MSRHRRSAQGSPLRAQLEALDEARNLAEGRLPEEALDKARGVLERASGRRSLSSEHTVVGFFGATGSGKSSLFNAVTGQTLASVAARRPTTSEPLAAVWGAENSEPLLDWLEVPHRHVMPSDDAPENRSSKNAPGGIILLDLPDFDSTALQHRDVVERLAGQVDVLVWVLDPQKYADAALHHDFLRPLASHGAVTLVVLNQIDKLAEKEVKPVVASLRGILADDGLKKVTIRTTSATTGDGVSELRDAIRAFADQRSAATERLAADAAAAAKVLGSSAEQSSENAARKVSEPNKAECRRLTSDLAGASSVDVVVDAVEHSYRRRAHAGTGWPVTRWLGRFRRDPLRRLNLHREDVNPLVNRTSLPHAGPAQRAQADSAVRRFGEEAGNGIPQPWKTALTRAARSNSETLPDSLDQAIAGTDLGAQKKSWWWPLVGTIQWLALAAALAGLLWLSAIFAAGYFQFSLGPTPEVEGFPVPTLLVATGLVLGIVLSILSAVIARFEAKRRARRARKKLTTAIGTVANSEVVAPVTAEISRYNNFRDALARAGGGR